MKKPIILLTLLLTFISSQSFAQSQNSNSVFDITSFFNDNGIKENENIKNYDDVIGSPYFEDKFKKANISLKPDLLFYVKYNAFVDQMEVMGKNDKSFALNKAITNLEINFIEENKIYRIFPYLTSGQTVHRFFNVINPDSKILLLKKEEVTLRKKVEAKTTYEKAKPARFLKASDSYYIKLSDKMTAIKLPSNKKEFAKLFPELKEDLLKYIKSEKIKLSKEASLTKLFKELNRLQN